MARSVRARALTRCRAGLINIKRPKLIIRSVALTPRRRRRQRLSEGAAQRAAMRRRALAEQWRESRLHYSPDVLATIVIFHLRTGFNFNCGASYYLCLSVTLSFPLKRVLAGSAREPGYQIFIRILLTSYEGAV